MKKIQKTKINTGVTVKTILLVAAAIIGIAGLSYAAAVTKIPTNKSISIQK